MSLKTSNTAISGPVRTATQAVPAAVIVEFIDAFAYDFSEKQYVAAVGLLLLVISFVQNLVEMTKGSALFKKDEPLALEPSVTTPGVTE